MNLELSGFIALLIFAVIGLGFVVGAIVVCIISILPGLKVNREIDKAEAKKKLEEKLKELELKSNWVDLNTIEESHTMVLETQEEDNVEEPEFIITEIEEDTPSPEIEDSLPNAVEEINTESVLDKALADYKLSPEEQEKLKSILNNSL